MRLCRVYVQQSLEIDGTKVKVNTQEDNSREEQRGYTFCFFHNIQSDHLGWHIWIMEVCPKVKHSWVSILKRVWVSFFLFFSFSRCVCVLTNLCPHVKGQIQPSTWLLKVFSCSPLGWSKSTLTSSKESSRRRETEREVVGEKEVSAESLTCCWNIDEVAKWCFTNSHLLAFADRPL